MFEEIITSKELKFNDLEKKVYRFICFIGCLIIKVSSNLVEKVIETVPVTDSYRKAEQVIDTTTNTSISHEKIRKIVLKIGDKITNKEKEEIKLYEKNQLVAGLKEITALFEETDG